MDCRSLEHMPHKSGHSHLQYRNMNRISTPMERIDTAQSCLNKKVPMRNAGLWNKVPHALEGGLLMDSGTQ